MHGLIISNTYAVCASLQAHVNKGLNILPNILWLMACNHTVDSIFRQSRNYNYAKHFNLKRQSYNYDKTTKHDLNKHCLNKLCKNTVCFLPTVPWSTEKITYNNIPFSQAAQNHTIITNKRSCMIQDNT